MQGNVSVTQQLDSFIQHRQIEIPLRIRITFALEGKEVVYLQSIDDRDLGLLSFQLQG